MPQKITLLPNSSILKNTDQESSQEVTLQKEEPTSLKAEKHLFGSNPEKDSYVLSRLKRIDKTKKDTPLTAPMKTRRKNKTLEYITKLFFSCKTRKSSISTAEIKQFLNDLSEYKK